MFEKYTERAWRIVFCSGEEAKALNHDYVSTEHILLSLIKEGEGAAVKVLELLGISLDIVREQIFEAIGPDRPYPLGDVGFKRVLDLSQLESARLGHDYIGTEHILLGLIREGEGVAAKVLKSLGVDLDQVRQLVTQPQPQYPSPVSRQRSETNAHAPAKPMRPIRVTMRKRRNGDVRVDVTGGPFVAATLVLRDSNDKIHHVQIKE